MDNMQKIERSKNINNEYVAKIEQIKENVLFKGINKSMPIFPDHFSTGLLLLKCIKFEIDGLFN